LDNKACLVFKTQTLVSDAAIWIKQRDIAKLDNIPEELTPLTPLYDPEPKSFYLDKKVEYKIRVSGDMDVSNTGIFTQDPNGSLAFLSNGVKSRGKIMYGRLLELKPFALMRDTKPPSIKNVSLNDLDTLTVQKEFVVTFQTTDSGSGIDDDRLIETILDGKKILNEYDPEKDIVKTFKTDLSKGGHEFVIKVADNVGNAVQKKLRLFAK
ncbi:MAG: hypothetical protein ABIA63_09885, partial [bacterium]